MCFAGATYGFEFRDIRLLDWLPLKARLLYYVTCTCWERYGFIYLHENGIYAKMNATKLNLNANSALRFLAPSRNPLHHRHIQPVHVHMYNPLLKILEKGVGLLYRSWK